MTPNEAYLVAKQTLLTISPEILMILVATVMMTAGAFVRLPRRNWAWITFGTLVLATGVLILHRTFTPDPYAAVAINDALSGYARLALLLVGMVLLGLAQDQVDDARAPEFFGALLMVHAGAMLVAAANDLVFLFVGLELVSIPTYLLLYLARRNVTTQEAAMKYFFLSIFSSGLLLFGFAYFYGLTGVSNLKAASFLVHWNDNILPYPQPNLALIALVFVMAGLCFRVAAVPFHWYVAGRVRRFADDHGRPAGVDPQGSRVPRHDPRVLGRLRVFDGEIVRRQGRQPGAGLEQGRPPGRADRRGDHDPWQHRGIAARGPETPARVFVDRPCRLPDDRHLGRVPQRPGRRREHPGQRGGDLLPRHVCPDDPGCLRRDHRPQHARAAGRDDRRPNGPVADPARGRPSP